MSKDILSMNYTHLSIEERRGIQELKAFRININQIFSTLCRYPSTIYRELARNKSDKRYEYVTSNNQYLKRRKSKPKKIEKLSLDVYRLFSRFCSS